MARSAALSLEQASDQEGTRHTLAVPAKSRVRDAPSATRGCHLLSLGSGQEGSRVGHPGMLLLLLSRCPGRSVVLPFPQQHPQVSPSPRALRARAVGQL